MEIKLLADNAQATKTIIELLKNCESASWAVAWATENPVLNAAYEYRHKFKYFVLGTHGYVTAPSVLERFQSEPRFKVQKPSGPLFHPKVYLFNAGDEWTAMVGSHNLTGAAFASNTEVSTVVTCKQGEPALMQLFAFVENAWSRGQRVTPEWLYSYAANHRRASRAHIELEKWVDVVPSKAQDNKPGPQELLWAEFVALVKQDVTHGLEGRLQVLESMGVLFRKKPNFSELELDDRKRIAGLMTQKEDSPDWAWFGAMRASPSFGTTIKKNSEGISAALDHIPLIGPVNEEDYENFKADFLASFDDNLRAGGGIATGTRLLAMKRPDQFVCINKPNKKGIGDHFGRAWTTLSLDNYWERIVLQIRSSPWWLAPEPTSILEKRIWAGRAAMLDAIYYDPSTR